MSELNKIISLESYDRNSAKFHFKFLKKEKGIIRLKISYYSLTVFKTEYPIEPNSEVVYYVGINPETVEYPDKLKLSVEFGSESQFFEVNNREKTLKFPELNSFNTDTNDESYFTYCEVFDREVYSDEVVKIEEGDLVVDIGANYGFFTKYAEQKGARKIYSYEPSQKIFPYLEKNLQNNKKVLLSNSAISNYNGIANFVDSENSAGSRFNGNGYEVNVKDINDVILNEIPYQIDFLKVDCEGAENQIFESISSDSLSKIKKIAVEYHDEKGKNIILQKLQSCNFVINKDENSIIFSSNPTLIEKKRKIALINTYCDTPEKLELLESLVKNIKSFGVDVLCYSPLKLPEFITKICDFYFFTKENPILPWELRPHLHWYIFQIPGNRVTTFQRGYNDYGWAGYYQVKKMAQFALTFDYDIFYHILYDVELNETLIDSLRKNDVNYIHKLNTGFGPTFHLFVMDKSTLFNLEQSIDLHRYIDNNQPVEDELKNFVENSNIRISELPVIERKSYWDNVDMYNYSPFEEMRFFISKNKEMDIWLGNPNPYEQTLSDKLRIVFYHTNVNEIIVSVNYTPHKIKIKNWEIVEFPISSNDVKEISFRFDDKFYDFSKDYEKIVMNQIYYNHYN